MIARELPRRTFLKAAGVSIGLPLLEAMQLRAETSKKPIKRMVLIGRPLGFHAFSSAVPLSAHRAPSCHPTTPPC